jgi:hypothetical protein
LPSTSWIMNLRIVLAGLPSANMSGRSVRSTRSLSSFFSLASSSASSIGSSERMTTVLPSFSI